MVHKTASNKIVSPSNLTIEKNEEYVADNNSHLNNPITLFLGITVIFKNGTGDQNSNIG